MGRRTSPYLCKPISLHILQVYKQRRGSLQLSVPRNEKGLRVQLMTRCPSSMTFCRKDLEIDDVQSVGVWDSVGIAIFPFSFRMRSWM